MTATRTMEWIHLGHAMWLASVGGLRILFDPLLYDEHHGGVFRVTPPREIDAEALRADFIVVSHAHPDHFDVRSLKRLAALDRDSVVLTADALVADTARRLGFRDVARVQVGERVELDGGSARLYTTPSIDPAEWGVVVASEGATAWNQVDTVPAGVDDVRRALAQAAASLALPELATGPGLALARWQPLLEIAAPLGDATSFPYAAYAELLDQIAATSARTVVPSSAGSRHAAPFAWMNRLVYPVSMERAMRDIAARAPSARVLPATIGASYRVCGSETSYDASGGAALVRVGAAEPYARTFAPFEVPALRDPNVDGKDEGVMRRTCEAWIRSVLAPALVSAFPAMGSAAALRFVVEIVFPRETDAYTLVVDAAEARVARGFDDDYDALNAICGSHFVDVIEGRRHWGEPLLAGMLRASSRAYAVSARGLARRSVGLTFLYYGLSYDESVRRWVESCVGSV